MSGNHDEIHVLSAMNVNISTSNNRWYALCESTPDKSEADLAISDDEVFENGNYMYVPFNFDNVNVNTTDLDHPGDSNYKVKRIFAGSGTAMLLSSTRDHDAFGLQIGIPLFRMGYPLGWPAVGDKVGEDWLPGAHLYWHTNTGSSYRMLEHEKYFTANDLLTGTVLRDGHTWYLYDLRAQMEADGITPKVEECGTANGVPQYCYPAQGIGVRVYDELGSSAARVAATARPASL
ncbi:MAG: hypothetical protein HYV63_29580, partial [Candidatus Schekmanbacteria bacterium]|nr:hypothetical protein [Candidatus Schekmanbacteria bacterium]